MTRLEVIEELENKIYDDNHIDGYHMMATQAFHQLGKQTKNVQELCFIYNETKDYYVGQWITGFGLVDVLFPKTTTTALTKQQTENLLKMKIELKHKDKFKTV